MDNLSFYNEFRSVPREAQKTISGGKLKGFTDVNPMWRIKRLTEVFGPVGIGWYIDDVKFWSETIGENGDNGRKTGAYCELNLYVKVDGQWSKPIKGIGGSTAFASGVLNDDAYKMAYTDAISIACKALGFCADIYFNKDTRSRDNVTKYDEPVAPAKPRMNDKQFVKACERIENGEPIILKVEETYALTPEQQKKINSYK